MPKSNEPQHFEPAWLERSLDRYYTWGLIFMAFLILAFPLYKLREPGLRDDAKAERQQEYVTTGSELFSANCASCHGKSATGGEAPTLNSEQFLKQTSDEQAALIITGGISGSEMSAWSIDFGGALTDQQILQLVTYIRSLEADAPSIPDWRRGAKAESVDATVPSTEPADMTSDASGAVVVDIEAGDYYFKSSTTTFTVGVPYHFVVHNTGQADHEFMIVEPIAAGEMPMEMMDDMAVGHIEEDDLVPAQTTTLDVTFTEPYPAGSLELSCHVGEHYQKGMHLPIVVLP
jgi:mono/diheme cytochrome c family protein/uncharacterized cupredoxin-like copper-binding protein